MIRSTLLYGFLSVNIVAQGHIANWNLVTELCVGFCDGKDCRTYSTPLSTCYSGQSLFPNDPSWGDVDFLDEIVDATLKRTFFRTNDSTCRDATDEFSLPLDECVGPFGTPRPWGKFSLVTKEEIDNVELRVD